MTPTNQYHLSQYNALWTRLRKFIDSSCSLLTYQDLVAQQDWHPAAPSSPIIAVDGKPYYPGKAAHPQWLSAPTLLPSPKDTSFDYNSLDPSVSSDNDSSFAGDEKEDKCAASWSP
jgi:hypothetical protein